MTRRTVFVAAATGLALAITLSIAWSAVTQIPTGLQAYAYVFGGSNTTGAQVMLGVMFHNPIGRPVNYDGPVVPIEVTMYGPTARGKREPVYRTSYPIEPHTTANPLVVPSTIFINASDVEGGIPDRFTIDVSTTFPNGRTFSTSVTHNASETD